MPPPKSYCFTVNNPTEPIPYDPELVKYLVYQRERGSSGTEHFQGYIEFAQPRTLTRVKEYPGLERAYLDRRRGSPAQASEYCKKSEGRIEGPWEFGIISRQGKRNDLAEFKEDVESGLPFDEAFDKYPEIFARYPRYCNDVYERFRNRNLPPRTYIPRSDWQKELMEIVSGTPDPRQVLWYTDVIGNTGKSYFANNTPFDSYVITGGRFADIYYAYRFEKVVIFDWPRDGRETFPYTVVEAFKNGYFLSTKYETKRIRFEIPHVIVFSNFSPDLSKLSEDRWKIKHI